MKTYYDINEYHIKLGKTYIPKKEDHYDYVLFLEEIKSGKAQLLPYIPTWDEIRKQRNTLLKDSDWATITDATPKPSKEAWLEYRQALRNISQDFNNPEDVIWLTIPLSNK